MMWMSLTQKRKYTADKKETREQLNVTGHSTEVTMSVYLLYFPQERKRMKGTKWGWGVRTPATRVLWILPGCTDSYYSKCGPRTSISIAWQLVRAARPGPTESESTSPGDSHPRSSCVWIYPPGPYSIWWTQKVPFSPPLFLQLVSKKWAPAACRHHPWQGLWVQRWYKKQNITGPHAA